MKKTTALLIAGLVILAASFVWIGYSWTRNTLTDTSWVETANNLMGNYRSYINDTDRPPNSTITMAFIRMSYSGENGTSGLLYYGDGDTLSLYLTNLLKQANVPKGTVNWNQLDEILTYSNALRLSYRAGSAPGNFSDLARKYNVAYFILDSQNEEMKGTIIAEWSPDRFDVLALGKLP